MRVKSSGKKAKGKSYGTTIFVTLSDLAERIFLILKADMRSTVLYSDGQKLGTE